MAASLTHAPRRRMFMRAATISAILTIAGTVLLFSQRYLHCFPAPKLFAQSVPLIFAIAAATAARLALPRIPLLPLAAVLAWITLSYLRTQVSESFALVLLPLLSAAGIFFLAAQLASYPSERRRLLAAFILSHLGCAFYAIAQYFGQDPLSWSVDYGIGRAFSTIGNPNFLAGQMVLAIPVLLAISLGRKGPLRPLARLAAVAAFAALLMAQTRGAIIGLGFGLGMGAILYRLRWNRLPRSGKLLIWPVIGASLIALYFSFPRLNSTGISLPAQIASSFDLEQPSARQRFFWWRGAALLFRASPLIGSGLGNFQREFPRAARGIILDFPDLRPAFCDHPHNDYLYILCEQGIIGLGLLLWFAAACARRALACRSEGREVVSLGVLAGLAGVAVHAIWNMPFIIPSTLLAASLIAGLVFADDSPPACAAHSESEFSSFRPAVAAILLLAGGIALGYRPGIILVAQNYLNGARIMKENSSFGPAAYLARQSLKLTQAPWRQHFMLGGILYGQHYFNESLKAFRQDEAENPWGADSILHQGKSLRQMGLYDEAEAEARRALELVPNYAAAAVTIAVLDYYRARDAREQGRDVQMAEYLKRADVWLNYALGFFPRDAEALKVRGYVAVMDKRLEQALVSWKAYLEIVPDDDNMRRLASSLEADLSRTEPGRPGRLWDGAPQVQSE